MRKCLNCGLTKPRELFPKEEKRKTCNKCHSEYTYRLRREKLLLKYPEIWTECDDDNCLLIYRKCYPKCLKCGLDNPNLDLSIPLKNQIYRNKKRGPYKIKKPIVLPTC